MVIQHHTDRFIIDDAARFTFHLEKLSKFKKLIKALFGIVGLCTLAIVAFPFILVLIWYFTFQTRKMLKEARQEKEQLQQAIKNGVFVFEELAELEEKLSPIVLKLEELAYVKIQSLLFKRLLNNLKLFHKELVETKIILQKSYTYSTEDLGLNAEEFKAYTDQFKELQDLWDYDTTREEEEVVFNHKKQLKSA